MPHTRYTRHRSDRCQTQGPSGKPPPPPPPAEPEEPPPPTTCAVIGTVWCEWSDPPITCYLEGGDKAAAEACLHALCFLTQDCVWSVEWINDDTGERWQASTLIPFSCGIPLAWEFIPIPYPGGQCDLWAALWPPCACS